MEEARAELDAVHDALAAAREEVARLETLRADQGRLLVEELKRDLRDCFIEPVREGISLSTFTRLSVGLNVSRMSEGYFVTAYRGFNRADERRLSFEISTGDFLEFADGVAKLAEAERLASPLEERVLAGEEKPERVRR